MNKIHMKQKHKKPKKPKREIGIKKEYVIDNHSNEYLSDILNNVPLYAYIDIEYDYYNEKDVTVKFVWEDDESEESYQLRLREYEQKLKKYNEWYEENREEIERRSKDLAERRRAKEIDRAKKTIEVMRKKLERLSLDGSNV